MSQLSQQKTNQIKNILKGPEQPTTKQHKIIHICWAATFVVSQVGWYIHHQAQPIPPEKRVSLSTLVGEVSQTTGETRQKIWNRMKVKLGVRRIDGLKNRDYNRALEIIQPTKSL